MVHLGGYVVIRADFTIPETYDRLVRSLGTITRRIDDVFGSHFTA